MATLTIQPSDEDTYLDKGSPDANNGTSLNLLVDSSVFPKRSILKFDFSALPSSVLVDDATFSIYFHTVSLGTPEGRTYKVKRLTEIGWLEGEATWNDYKSSTAWAVAGGDFTTEFESSLVVPAVGNWLDFNVKNLIQRAKQSVSEVIHLILVDTDETGAEHQPTFYSSRETTNLTLRPKLVINYTAIDTTITKPSRPYSDIKEAYFKDGWQNEKYLYIEQDKAQPCVVQFVDVYADTENEE